MQIKQIWMDNFAKRSFKQKIKQTVDLTDLTRTPPNFQEHITCYVVRFKHLAKIL